MKQGQLISIYTALAAASVMITGCNPSPDMNSYVGTYVGQLISKSSTGTTQEALLADISAPTSDMLEISGHSINDPSKADVAWQLAQDSSGQLTLLTAGGLEFHGALSVTSAKCFTTPTESKLAATLCADQETVSIEVTNPADQSSVYLKLTRQISGAPAALEAPAAYTSDQLRDLAKTRSFNSRLEFDTVAATKLTARTQYLNLLPHLSNVSVAAISTYSGILGTLGAMGDLVPFLLPDRWLQARQAGQLSDAEEAASEIMQLNAAQTVEGLAVVSAQNIVLHEQLKQDLLLVQNMEQGLSEAERAGHLPPGASLSIASVDNALQQTISNLESTMALQMTALAQAAGFINPAAITTITASPIGDINNPPSLQLDTLEARVVQRSPEIGQLNLVIAAANTAEPGRAFQWMDPSGDPQGGVGFGLPSYVQIGKTTVDELETEREQLNSTLLRQITDAYNNYEGWIESYQLAAAGVATQLKRIDIAKLDLATPAADFAVGELRDALNQLVINHVAQVSARYAWYASTSQINRLLLEGPYQLPNPNINK